MHTETGQLVAQGAIDSMSPEERGKYVPVVRDLSRHEEADMQIRMYSPCACGSGKKFKFCHYTKR